MVSETYKNRQDHGVQRYYIYFLYTIKKKKM